MKNEEKKLKNRNNFLNFNVYFFLFIRYEVNILKDFMIIFYNLVLIIFIWKKVFINKI